MDGCIIRLRLGEMHLKLAGGGERWSFGRGIARGSWFSLAVDLAYGEDREKYASLRRISISFSPQDCVGRDWRNIMMFYYCQHLIDLLFVPTRRNHLKIHLLKLVRPFD